MARQESSGPVPPRAARVKLGRLVPADVDTLDGDDDLDEVEWRDHHVEEMAWTGRRRVTSSRLAAVRTHEWKAPGASLTASVLEGVEVTALSASGSSWWNVEVDRSRIGSAELYDSTWRNVAFAHCKLGYLNLRGAALTDVAFTDCTIAELDLGRATAARLSFTGCRIDRIELNWSRLTDVDLRGARLADVGSLDGLRGATITVEQLLDLAPALAQRLGVHVD